LFLFALLFSFFSLTCFIKSTKLDSRGLPSVSTCMLKGRHSFKISTCMKNRQKKKKPEKIALSMIMIGCICGRVAVVLWSCCGRVAGCSCVDVIMGILRILFSYKFCNVLPKIIFEGCSFKFTFKLVHRIKLRTVCDVEFPF
jgi:hypothetical protein